MRTSHRRFLLLPACLGVALLAIATWWYLSEPAMADCDRLKQLAQGALNYKDVHGEFPPPVVLGENGKPMHSWRVLLLPYVEANAFLNGYDREVAWNAPSNADLADGTRHIDRPKFPDPADVREVYQPHLNRASREDFTTDYLMVVRGTGSTTAFKVLGTHLAFVAPRDENPDELIIVQVTRSHVHWMEPKDIVLAAPAPDWGITLAAIKDEIVGCVHVVGADVSCLDRDATLWLLGDR